MRVQCTCFAIERDLILSATMQVSALLSNPLFVLITIVSWCLCLRDVLVMILPRTYDKFLGQHFDLYCETPLIMVTTSLFLQLSAAMNMTYLLYSKRKNIVDVLTFPLPVPLFVIKFFKSQAVFWAIAAGLTSVFGGIHLHSAQTLENQSLTMSSWMLILFWAICYVIMAEIGILQSFYFAVMSYLTSSYYTSRYKELISLITTDLNMHTLACYATLRNSVKQSNRVWRVLLFNTVLCFVPVISCCIIFSIVSSGSAPIFMKVCWTQLA